MSASEASRSFSAVLDSAERGEMIAAAREAVSAEMDTDPWHD